MTPTTIRFPMTTRYIVTSIWLTSIVSITIMTILGITLILFGLVENPSGPDAYTIFVGAGMFAIWLVVLPLTSIWRLRSMLGQFIEASFDEQGLRQDAFGRHFQGDWSAVTAATMRGPAVLVKLRGGGTTGFPISAFASPAEAAGLVAFMRSKIAAGKASAGGRS